MSQEINRNIVILLGKSDDIHIFWNYSTYKKTNNLDEIYNTNLFENENLKYAAKKNDEKFFNAKIQTNNQVLIKGFEKQCDFMKNYIIYDFDKINIIQTFVQYYNLVFSEAEQEFIDQNCGNLNLLISILYFRNSQIEIKYWKDLLNIHQNENWMIFFKEHRLVQHAVFNESSTIPILYFLNKLNYNKKIFSKFILTTINAGEKIWEYNSIWKKIIDI